jgi:hypothetical protein
MTMITARPRDARGRFIKANATVTPKRTPNGRTIIVVGPSKAKAQPMAKPELRWNQNPYEAPSLNREDRPTGWLFHAVASAIFLLLWLALLTMGARDAGLM